MTRKKILINVVISLLSVVAMFILFMLSPFGIAYAYYLLDFNDAQAVALLTVWLFSSLYWGTFIHAKGVMNIMEIKRVE